MHRGSVQDLIDAGIMFCGTPDQVYQQIVEFCEYCGGMGNLLMMGHAGFLSHEDTVANLTLFAKEVMPRLKDLEAAGGGSDRGVAFAAVDVEHIAVTYALALSPCARGEEHLPDHRDAQLSSEFFHSNSASAACGRRRWRVADRAGCA